MNLDNPAIPIIGAKKKTTCTFCARPSHPFTTKCNYNDLTSRIKNLLDRNALLPELIRQNKELVEMGVTFQTQFDNISKALLICEKTVMEFENGPNIWKRFQERLDKELWVKTLSPGTGESQQPSSPKSTTQSETESKPSTGETQAGETTAPDSLL